MCKILPPKYQYIPAVTCIIRTDLSTESEDRSCIWGERSRGCPFLSQLIWGGGLPSAWHSRPTALSWVTCTSLGTVVSPEIDGGTMKRQMIMKSAKNLTRITKNTWLSVPTDLKQRQCRFCSPVQPGSQPNRCTSLNHQGSVSAVLDCCLQGSHCTF